MTNFHFTVAITLLLFCSCAENYTSTDYLKKVLANLEKVESASYWQYTEGWAPGDTAPYGIHANYVESMRNPFDSTIGSTFAVFKNEKKDHLVQLYDGKIRTLINHEEGKMTIDSFKVMHAPFRVVNAPFFNYTQSILSYVLEEKDSVRLEQIDHGDLVFLRATISKSRQVEFHGKPFYIPKSPFCLDPTSIYEMWIDKKTNLPVKIRREMEHDISVCSVSTIEFNKLQLKEFVASDYLPLEYEIRYYSELAKLKQKSSVKESEMIGTTASEWTLLDKENRNISLSSLKSKVIVLQFTSVVCGPCRASISFLNELSKEYKKVDLDLVAIECATKSTSALKRYADKNAIGYKFLKSNKEVLQNYHIKSYPIFFILDENREIVNVIKGYGKDYTDGKIRGIINGMM